VLKKNNIIQVPTGHGKTIIIAALARALCDQDNGKVVVVTMNTYLNHHAFNKYTIPNTCKKFHNMPQNG
jgi:superfamily II DNA or RNA helicase